MYKCNKCNKCNKGFNFRSKLNEHINRKTFCNKQEIYECKLCKIKIKYESEYLRHEKTKKHINNLNRTIDNKSNNLEPDNTELLMIEKKKINQEINKLRENDNNIINNLKQDNAKIINENNNLINELKKVNIELQMLKTNFNNKIEKDDYIYIVHERTFVELNTNIYKIGKTKNLKTRLNAYTKGSKMLFSHACNDCSSAEKKILTYLKNNDNFIHVKEYGNEYFQCNLQDMIDAVYTLLKN